MTRFAARASWPLAVAALTIAFSAGATAPAEAQDGSWTTTGSGAWSDSGNWLGGAVADGADNTATFVVNVPGSGITVNLDAARTIGNLVFGDDDPLSPGNWVLSGNALTLQTTAPDVPTISVGTLGSGAVVRIDSVLAGSDGLEKAGIGTLILAGNNTYAGATTISGGTLQIGAGGTTGSLGSGNVVNNGVLVFNRSDHTVSNVITGTGSLRKDGSNELILSGSNNYSGGTTVTGGLLRATDNTIGSGSLTLQGGATFFNVAGAAGGVAPDNDFQNTVVLGTGGGGFRAGWGAMTLSGQIGGVGSFTIVNDNAVTVTNTGNSYEGNTIIGASGSGNNATLRLGASEVIPHGPGMGNLVFNASSGGTASLQLDGQTETINALISGGAGTSAVTGPGTLRVGANGADGSFSGNVTGSLNFIKLGAGTQTLAGTGVNYTGATDVQEGALVFQNTTSFTGGSSMTVATGAELEFNVPGSRVQLHSTELTGGGTFIKTGPGELWLGAQNQTAAISMAAGGLIDVREGTLRNEYLQGNWSANQASLNIHSGATVRLWDANITVDALTGAGTISKGQNNAHTLTVGVAGGSGTFSGTIVDRDAGSSAILSLTKAGAGTQVLTGANDYAGATTINAGTLRLSGGDDRLSASTWISLANTAGATLDLDGNNQTVRYLAGGGGTGGTVVNTGGATSTLTLNLGAASGNFGGSVQGDIRVMVRDSTTKNTHLQTFSGSNTYTGGTVIDNGHLRITGDAGLGAVPAAFDPANVTLLNGGVLQNNDSDPVLHANRGVLLAGPAQIFVGWNKSFTIPGVISGPGSLTKPDSGRLVLTGTANTFEGGTTVTGGYLQLSGDGSLGAVPAAPTVNLTLNGGGVKNNSSTNVLHANRTILLGASGGWFTSGWSLPTTIHGQITGAGAFTVNNDGGPIIPTNPANDYAGNTTIGGTLSGASGNNATLRLGASEVIPHGPGKGNLVFNASSGGTATLELNGHTETINALVSGGAGTSRITGAGTLTFGAADAGGSFTGHITSSPNINLVKIGTGTQTLSGTLIDHFGTTTVSGGTLRFLELDDLHSSQLTIAAGATAEFSNSARTFDRFSATSIEGDGTFVKTGTGLLRTGNATDQFARWNMTGGLIDVRQGEFRADYQNNDPVTGAWANNKASLNVEAGAFVSMVGGNHISVDAVSGAGTIQNIHNWGVGVLTIGSNNGSGTFGGTMRDSGGVMALTKTGAGTQTLTGANTYSGPTTISGGTLMVNGTHLGGGLYTVRDGVTLGGTGIVGATVSIDAGGTHAPGASVGEQTLGAAVWNPGGAFEFEVNDALGTAGGPAGWDLATISTDYGAGTLDIQNLTEGSFQIDIVSLMGTSAGPLANFNPTVPYTWEFVTYDALLGEFDPGLFVLDAADFLAHNAIGTGRFTILQTDGGLAIGFIPEPGTLLMALAAMAMLLGWRRRNRRNA